MKRYTGKLSAEATQLIKNNKLVENVLSNKLSGLGRVSNSNLITIDESIAKYNAGITKNEIEAWVWYRRKQGIPMYGFKKYFFDLQNQSKIDSLIKQGCLFVVGNKKYLPLPAFTYGNMYNKQGEVKKAKTFIVDTYGEKVYQNHLDVITNAMPPQLSITNPIATERPRILAVSRFASEFEVEELKPETGVLLNHKENLVEAYKDWLRSLDHSAFKKADAREIINYYLNGENKPRSIEKDEWSRIQKRSRDEGEALFTTFLHEAVIYPDQQKIDALWNTTYNGNAALNYKKIPIGIEVSKTFHGFEFDAREAQREAVAFMELNNSGILAYDVGVGKTISAIMELSNAIKNGKCSRPLVVVPNPTYKNWIKEMFGFEENGKVYNGLLTGTGITLNDWYNLGSKIEDKLDLEKAVPPNSITLVTYEGLMKIGFSETVNEKLFFELSNILDQADITSERQLEKQNEEYRDMLGVGLKDTIADIDTLKFDYIVVDEAHNFKNVFASVKKDDDDEKKRFNIKGGNPSARAIKLFFLANYVQRTYGRNTMLLSATPFTNSPLEVYSMLSYVGYHTLKEMKLVNIKAFFEQFIQETSEYVVGVDGKIKESNVVKSFNNRLILQKLIHNLINFKTGEEANIPRPCKINLPKVNEVSASGEVKKLSKDKQVLTYLQMTPEQEAIQASLNAEASAGASKEDPGKLLRLMGASLNNALSPFIYNNATPVDYTEFVEASPKIKYALECCKSVKKYHEERNEDVSGQVIYIDRGKEYFQYIKEWLEQEAGYKKGVKMKSDPRKKVDEIEIIIGGMSAAKKEKIKEAFLDGTCKVIIGTSTIREGINLQKYGTVLYNLYPNWNPTDVRQLEGRIWRQKNTFGYVRIVMPLIENSMDVFVFQKLEEKTSRINDIWSKGGRGNVLDEESLDTNEVKFALITDPNVLLDFELKQEREELFRSKNILQKQVKDLEEFKINYNKYLNYRKAVEQSVVDLKHRLETGHILYLNGQSVGLNQLQAMDEEDLNKSQLEDMQRALTLLDVIHVYNTSATKTDKELAKVKATINRSKFAKSWDYDYIQFKEYMSRVIKTEKAILAPRGFKAEDDLTQPIEELKKELSTNEKAIEDISSDEFQDQKLKEIIAKKEAMAISGSDMQSRINGFKSMNYLLSYKFADVNPHACTIPTQVKKPSSKDTNKETRKRLAIAKAKALKLKLLLLAA